MSTNQAGSTGAGFAAGLFGASLLLGDAGYAAEPTRVPSAAYPDALPVANHLALGRSYLERREYARAVLEFEQVLRFDNLPPDLHEQAEIYARSARDYAAGRRLSGFGYAETGGGYYRENVTRSTNAAGGHPARDWFWKARAGGGVSYIASDDVTVDATLDYRFRYYDNPQRRDDSDLRWNAAVKQSLPHGSQAIGVRGRASYRGHPGYRNDYGVFVDRSFAVNADNRIEVEGEFRTRRYPLDLRQRSRDIAEVTASWTHALLDGKASLTLSVNGGREWATHNRPDGNSNFFGAEFNFGMDFSASLGSFLLGLWEHNAYLGDRTLTDSDFEPVSFYRRSDDIYEIGGGLTYGFARDWSLRPQVLYTRDESNTVGGNYSSTELWLTIRKRF
ncbi:hypothetical protein [uncultured Thiodictyon sp.]|uniref:hypothetical protein n=1 Tax=uncultured Thiodictyon sp. TaxID=1846217 RepID=UPI0025FCD89D|nr:hypothetical protein [uncultured Thiodictyon sp.]